MRRTIQLIAILIVALAISPGWAADNPRGKGGGGRQRNENVQGGLTAAQAATMAQRQSGGGKVLAVKESKGGYRVKVLTPSGEVRSISISGRR